MRHRVNAVFQPGIQLLQRVRYPYKFALISMVFVFPLAISLSLGITEINTAIEFTEKELAGTQYLQGIQKLVANLQASRGMTEAGLSGEQAFRDHAGTLESALHTDLQLLNDLDQQFGARLETTQSLMDFQRHWQQFQKKRAGLSRQETFERHTALIDRLLVLMAHVGDRSNLILDPSLDSYYLMDAVIIRFPQWTETLGKMRGLGIGIISRGIVTDQERSFLSFSRSTVAITQETTLRNFTVAFHEKPALREALDAALQDSLRANDVFLRMLDATLLADEPSFPAANDYWETATRASRPILHLISLVLPALDKTLHARISAAESRRGTLEGVTVVALLLVFYMFVSFYLSTIASVARMRDVSDRLLHGELNPADFPTEGYDEMTEAVEAFRAVARVVKTKWQVAEAETTRARKAEARVAESEERLGALMDGLADGLITIDKRGIVESFNEAASRMFGYTADAIIGRNVSLLLPTPHSDPHDHYLERYIRTGGARFMNERQEVEGMRKDGTFFPMDIHISEVSWGDRHLFTGIIRDLTNRKVMEEDLRKSHELNQELLASIPSILISVDAQGRITQWNTTAEEIFGLLATEVKGKLFQACGIQWNWSFVNEGIRQCRETQQIIRLDDLRYVNTSGKEGFLGITLTPIRGEGRGKISEFLMVGADITKIKQLQAQLVLAQKMESIGQLAAGIAHEINTPSQFVSDNLRFLQESFGAIQKVLAVYGQVIQALPRDTVDPQLLHTMDTILAEADLAYVTEEIPKAFQQSLDGAERVTNIVRAMKDFSHPGTAERKPIDLNKTIESTVTVARNEWKYVADLVLNFDPIMPPIPCFPGEFNQVILNLVVNAAHAIGTVMEKATGGKGTITITTRMQEDWVEIRIADTGTGIPEYARTKIFDPFFTTKEVGKGTGQGLAIAHDVIVKKHGGRLTFETKMGTGTTFIIQLPRQLEQKKTRHDETPNLICG